jgi:hypothetical protein
MKIKYFLLFPEKSLFQPNLKDYFCSFQWIFFIIEADDDIFLTLLTANLQ